MVFRKSPRSTLLSTSIRQAESCVRACGWRTYDRAPLRLGKLGGCLGCSRSLSFRLPDVHQVDEFGNCHDPPLQGWVCYSKPGRAWGALRTGKGRTYGKFPMLKSSAGRLDQRPIYGISWWVRESILLAWSGPPGRRFSYEMAIRVIFGVSPPSRIDRMRRINDGPGGETLYIPPSQGGIPAIRGCPIGYKQVGDAVKSLGGRRAPMHIWYRTTLLYGAQRTGRTRRRRPSLNRARDVADVRRTMRRKWRRTREMALR